jgi:uncharacterized membrane protein
MTSFLTNRTTQIEIIHCVSFPINLLIVLPGVLNLLPTNISLDG